MKAIHQFLREKKYSKTKVYRMNEPEIADVKLSRPCPKRRESCQLNAICKSSVTYIQLGKIKNNLLNYDD
jgi:hypothetical protein